jgi:NAD(P)-dependent dehydrogenase (short-subunit alcohol dehydrogenase family)
MEDGMQSLAERVAVVSGASRGAGRGIALALGDAGAVVYVAARSTRAGRRPADGAPGTIEDTAEEVTRRGGAGVAVQTDFTREEEVSALFDRVRSDHGRLDIVANAVWGAADAWTSGEDAMASWGRAFWEEPAGGWDRMMMAGPYAYYLASVHAARLMRESGGGLIVGVTDGVFAREGEPAPSAHEGGAAMGPLLWDLAHACINRMLAGMAAEAKASGIAVVTLMPGFMRTERVVAYLKTEKQRRAMGFDRSESTEYIGRAVAALAADGAVLKKSGRIHFVADLAREYGFTDADGRQVGRFQPFG